MALGGLDDAHRVSNGLDSPSIQEAAVGRSLSRWLWLGLADQRRRSLDASELKERRLHLLAFSTDQLFSLLQTQSLLPLLRQSPYSTPSRVVFTGSVEAMREAYDADDFQCLSTAGPSKAYESTKYQCDLAALALQQQLEEEETSSDKTKDAEKGWSQPQVYLTHPGVVATSIMAEWLNIITATAMLWSFYFVSPWRDSSS